MGEIKKVLWPISPNESEKQSDQQLFSFFKVFQEEVNLEIQPVYVLSSNFFATSDYFEPIDVTELKKNMLAECQNYLEKNFKGVRHKEVAVIENSFSSQAAEVSLFNEYANEMKPDFVVMASHGRSGWARTFLGSFAESFLMQTKFPVILLGPQCQKVKNLKTALLPIQLNQCSQTFVEGFLDDHRLAFLEKITLFHKISMVDVEEIAWAPTLYGLTDFSTGDLLTKAKKTTEDYLKSFMDHPLSQKRLDYKISEQLSAVSYVIVEEAQNYDITVMRTDSSVLEANLLGSVTRDVIRQSTNPVVVYPHLFKK